MSTEGAPESQLAANGIQQQPHPHKASWVRIVFYLVLVAALGLIVWRIYESQKAAQSQASSQAAALLGRPVPVQVAAAE
jgi:membrane protein implicated in regulation of membrane protease activity